MAGTTLGALKAAAQRVGVDVKDYAAKLLAGERWCWGCRRFEPIAEFGSDRTRSDGVSIICRKARNRMARENYRRRRANPEKT